MHLNRDIYISIKKKRNKSAIRKNSNCFLRKWNVSCTFYIRAFALFSPQTWWSWSQTSQPSTVWSSYHLGLISLMIDHHLEEQCLTITLHGVFQVVHFLHFARVMLLVLVLPLTRILIKMCFAKKTRQKQTNKQTQKIIIEKHPICIKSVEESKQMTKF